jgi:L-threonylcarbamoyladenylate synthase
MILAGNTPESISAAAQAIRVGELIGLPTETVYGLAADADSEAAVAKIFAAKGRPSDHPLIVHVADASGVAHFASQVPDFAQALIAAFWPGPLTLILPRKDGVATASAGGQNSIGLRCPSHPVAQAVLKALINPLRPFDKLRPGQAQGERVDSVVWGLAAPSANQFGRVSPTTAAHVQGEFGDGLLILDGGACEVGIESTIIDCTRGQPILLRPGGISRAQIQAICKQSVLSNEELTSDIPRGPKASGTLESHYAPNASVRLMDAKALQAALDLLGTDMDAKKDGPKPVIAIYSRAILRTASAKVLRRRMPDDSTATAQQLFAVLRDFDSQGVKLIWVETPPDAPEWDGVRDRLARASA